MIYNYPPSAIRLNKTIINNYDFLVQTDNQDCLNVLVNITERIDIKAICRIIDETPYISDLHKDFLKLMLSHRKEKILEQAIIKNKNINIDQSAKDILFAGYKAIRQEQKNKTTNNASSAKNTQQTDKQKPSADTDKPSGPKR